MKPSRNDFFALLFLGLWHLVYFFPVTLGQQVWFTTDVLRLFYPFGVEYARALSQNSLPLWTPNLLAGFPLVAETQVAALYPLNLLLYKILPAYYAISYSNLLHLVWASFGMYALARSMNLRAASAMLAGFIFSFNGWVFGHLSHPTVLAALAWLPWSLYFLTRFQRSAKSTHRAAWFIFTALAVAFEFLSGSIQIAFFDSLAFLAVGIANELLWSARSADEKRGWVSLIARAALATGAPFLFGLGIAAIQLVPTAELVGYSVRSATSASFYTSYSLPVEWLAQFALPFFQGEPSEGTGEYWTWFGFAPLLLMLAAPFLRRDRRTIFYFVFALLMLSLAFGEVNPIFQWLYRLPIFGLFRVPARYLFLFTFAAAIASALAFDELLNRLKPMRASLLAPALIALVSFSAIGLAYTQPIEFWIDLWHVLPVLFGMLSALAIALAFAGRIARERFADLVLVLTIPSLALYAPPFLNTIDALSPVSAAVTIPRSLPVFQSSQTPERVWTDLSVFPSTPAIRASMFPNVSLIYDVASAQSYTSLSLARHETYLNDMSPAMLNLLNVRYLTVPLEPRAETKSTMPPPVFFLDLQGHMVIFPTAVSTIEVASFTERAENLENGTAVAHLTVVTSDGGETKFPLRVGIETADWDYDRKSGIKHNKPQIAHSFSGFWRSFGKGFEGHVYLARLQFPDGLAHTITGLRLDALIDSRLTVERISLLDEQSKSRSLATLAGKDNFVLAFLSDTVAIWENKDAMPRAFIAHSAEILDDAAALGRMRDPSFQTNRLVLLSEGNARMQSDVASVANDRAEITEYSPERVVLRVQTDSSGYLVLADSWYPGWQASVDGKLSPIYRANVLFRAVSIEAGQHQVVFEYQPTSFRIGALITAASIAALVTVAFVLRRKRDIGV